MKGFNLTLEEVNQKLLGIGIINQTITNTLVDVNDMNETLNKNTNGIETLVEDLCKFN